MAPKYRILLLFVISMIVTWFVFRPILKIAQQKGIVDNPDARKLQRVPVPVLGGVAVFFGIVVGLCFFKTMLSFTSLFAVLTAMIVMLYLGTIDDILNLSPFLRLGIEVVVVTLLIYGTHYSMCNFQGLWGIDQLPIIFSVPLSIVTMVGIINAINMIDGVDGLVSGFCIVACTLFGIIFFCEHEYSFAALAAVTVGALIPFFLHNVFGIKSKMFMGDGGTMMLGIVMSSMVIALCKYRIEYNFILNHQFGVLAFSLAVLAVPIFDTLRVMTYRVLHGHSPFFPDKNHLHHIFIEFGFSHIGTTMSEIVLELFVVAVWAFVWRAGASVDIQLYSVIAASLLVTFGVAAFLKREIKRTSLCNRIIRAVASGTHIEWDGFWLKIQNFVDGKSAIVALLLVLPVFASCSMSEATMEEEPGYGPDGLYYTPNPTCMAIFGDIQVYTENDELVQNYVNSLQWLKERQLRDADISCILHTGDVSNTNLGHQWRRFQSNTMIVSDCIPYYTSTGNHDYDWNEEEVITDRNSSLLNQHYDFPYLKKNLLASYEPGKLDNAVYRNVFAGQRMDIMMLEFAPREDVLRWANEYLAAHRDTKHILVTHEFLWRDGSLFTDRPYSERQFRELSASSPYKILTELVHPNENIACVLCGHVSNFARVVEFASRTERRVPAIEFNLQDEKDGGDGWIMLWDAKTPDDSVTVSIYNTVSGKYYQDKPVYAKFKFR